MRLHDVNSAPESRLAMEQFRRALPEACLTKLGAYVPDLPADNVERIRQFVEDAVILALPMTSYSVETLLRPTMHFVHWAVFIVGADLDAGIVFTRALIEHYVRETMPELTEGTRRNYRAWLFRVAEAANPEANPNNPMPLNERVQEAPYSAGELEALNRWAAGQRTPYLRANAAALLALGCGAGLSASEIVLVQRDDVSVDENRAVHVVVSGKTPRTVIASAPYEEVLRRAAASTKVGAFLFLPNRTRTTNDVVSAFIARTHRPRGTPTVRARKMRNTWLVRHLTNRVDVNTLMQAAGLQSLESISRLSQFVPAMTEQARISMLRGVS